MRPAARQRARTRPAWTTTPNGRRLPLDRLGRGCVADRKTKRLRTGVSGRQPVDPPERHMDHLGPRLARASPVSSACRSSQTGRQLSLCSTDSLQLPARLTTGCLLDPCGLAYSLARASRLHSQGRCGARLDNRAHGPRQRSRPKGRDGQGRATRTGGRGTGSGRDRHPRASGREHRPDQLGWRPARRPEPGTRPEGGRPMVYPNQGCLYIL